MKTLYADCNGIRVSITDISSELQALTSAERESKHQPLIWLDRNDGYPKTALQIVGKSSDNEKWRLTLAASGGGTTEPSERTVLCTKSALVLIAGQFVVRLKVDSGDVEWIQRCDHATCWEILPLPDEPAFIIHGELDITKLSVDGTILWQSGGRDIFTGPLSIEAERILATDFDGWVYSINRDTGKSKIIGQSKPFPH